MKDYIYGLNSVQLEAVTSNEKYIRVIAGAGSGKTKVLTSRIAYLIDKKNNYPNRVLAFTFTNKAANEMKERVENVLDLPKGVMNISTYHSFCSKFLRQEISHIGFTKNFIILDEVDQEDVIKDIKKEIDEFKQYKPKQLVSYISNFKTYNILPEEALKKAENNPKLSIPAQIYKEYCAYLKKNNYLDFDDLLIYTVEILGHFKEVREKWQAKFDHILVDEFQDTDPTQYQLLKLLSNETTNIFVVGDPDQTIYTWRGANIDIIFDFKNDFKNVKDYILNINYRSTKYILDCANELISNNKKRVKKDLIADGEDGNRPVVFCGASQELEGDWIANKIQSMIEKYNLKYSDFAILYRSNYYSGLLEHSLINARIPYEIYGNIKFYERKEVKDAMAFLRLVTNTSDVVSLLRVINVPKRGIGEKTLQNIVLNANLAHQEVYDYVKENYKSSDGEALGYFIDTIEKYKLKLSNSGLNYRDFLKDLLNDLDYMSIFDPIDDEDRIDNVHELGNIIFNSQVKNPEITLEEILESLTLFTSADSITNNDNVKLMTVHTAKGLEFPYVFVAGLSDGVFPNAKSLNDGDYSLAMEEERRLAYVAFTRAQKNLFLTYNVGYSYTINASGVESCFLREVRQFTVQSTVKMWYNKQDKLEDIGKVNEIYTHNATITNENIDYRPGMMVEHTKFGEGIILSIEDSDLRIAFKNTQYGVKLINKQFAGLKRK